MERINDYIILFFCSTILMLSVSADEEVVIPICVVVSLICFSMYFDKFIVNLLIYAAFCIMALFMPQFMYFTPLILYRFFNEAYAYLCLLYLGVIYINFDEFHIVKLATIMCTVLLSALLKYRTDKYLEEREHFSGIREKLNEYNLSLNSRNHELLEKQDYEITNATLNERNRIAREIHDSVGHILSSSILQIAALTAITKDETTKEYLQNINQTLTDGMNSIRSSIHNIHEDSINLDIKIKELIDSFDFCEISYNYDIDDEFPAKAKYTIIYIIKEALTNIIKHSNATNVQISISQNPAFYKIDIHDNGTKSLHTSKDGQGMGTISIYDRISSLGGTVNITKNDGYRIYITIPIERTK